MNVGALTRRASFALAMIIASFPAWSAEDEVWAALRSGGIALFRHAEAPGVGDPPGMRLDDCATQRNLSEAGRVQARRIGAAFRAAGVEPRAVLTSRWCRARETAELAFPGRVADAEAFDSFFDDRDSRTARTAAARAVMEAWRGPGPLVIVTHQVNVTALTGVFPASGEGVVLERAADGWRVAGRIRP